jgi:hypothetical protein
MEKLSHEFISNSLMIFLYGALPVVLMICAIVNCVLSFRRRPSLDTILARLVTKEEFDRQIAGFNKEITDLREQMHEEDSERSAKIYGAIRELGNSIRSEIRADRESMQGQINETNKEFRKEIINLLDKQNKGNQ